MEVQLRRGYRSVQICNKRLFFAEVCALSLSLYIQSPFLFYQIPFPGQSNLFLEVICLKNDPGHSLIEQLLTLGHFMQDVCEFVQLIGDNLFKRCSLQEIIQQMSQVFNLMVTKINGTLLSPPKKHVS